MIMGFKIYFQDKYLFLFNIKWVRWLLKKLTHKYKRKWCKCRINKNKEIMSKPRPVE